MKNFTDRSKTGWIIPFLVLSYSHIQIALLLSQESTIYLAWSALGSFCIAKFWISSYLFEFVFMKKTRSFLLILDLIWIIIAVELKWLFVKVVFICLKENCKKSFSSKSNRNKHERLKNHRPQTDGKNKIPYFKDVFHCPANGCVTKYKYKHNIVKHLKMCTDLKMKRNSVANIKVCPVCSKVFAWKSNRDRHVNNVHSQDLGDNIAFNEFDNQHDKQEQNQTMPSMVTSIGMVPSKVD